MIHYGGVEKQTYRNDLFVQQTMDLTIYAALTPERPFCTESKHKSRILIYSISVLQYLKHTVPHYAVILEHFTSLILHMLYSTTWLRKH